MLVRDLKEGMIVELESEHLSFCKRNWAMQEVKYLEVISSSRLRKPGPLRTSVSESRRAMYLGDRNKLNIYGGYSNRFVLIDGEIYGVEPSAWQYIKPVF